jgi:3',5'-cyclic AMP phosphodiesterase CpdA
MTFIVQITDTHVLPPGELLYGKVDTGAHLAEAVAQIGRMRPKPDVVLITGDLVERSEEACYRHFLELISPLEAPVYVLPGNHDQPEDMRQAFAETPYFPGSHPSYQFAIEDFPVRILALNSHTDGSELPSYGPQRLAWLKSELERSARPTLIAIHHPPMNTGIEFNDMGGTNWFQGIRSLFAEHPQVRLLICGHCHVDLCGRIDHVPVYMAKSIAHQLIAARGLNIAPTFCLEAAEPVLHHFLDGEFLSGCNPWPEGVDDHRIDQDAGVEWEALKRLMRGSGN